MDAFLIELLVVFVSSVVVGIVFRNFGLPSIIGQVLVGLVFGAWGYMSGDSVEVLHLMGTFGITLLLFLVGLEMDWREVRKLGMTFLMVFLLQSIGLFALFFVSFGWWFALGTIKAGFLAVALSFSSTIVVVKVLSENKELGSLTGKLSLGVLLLQDLLAIVLLVFLPTANSLSGVSSLWILLAKLLGLVLVVNVLGTYLNGWLMRKFIKSQEDLVLFGLVWLLLVLYLAVKVLGLNAEIGSFLAGLSLSSSWGHLQLVNKIKTLRDIFLTIFFVLLGLQVGGGSVNWILVVGLSFFVIFGKFVVSYLSALIAGLDKRPAFLFGVNLTQVSEFSLIVMSLGVGLGLWDNELVKIITFVGLITMALSTVLIKFEKNIYKALSNFLPWFFRSNLKEKKYDQLVNHVILLGCDRTGRGILSSLMKRKVKALVVDFNPEVVRRLNDKGVDAISADATDPEILELTNLAKAKMVISTIKDFEDTKSLLSDIRQAGIKVPVLVDAESASQAKDLYDAGASYVIFPHYVGGLHLSQMMRKHEKDRKVFDKLKIRQAESLKNLYDDEF